MSETKNSSKHSTPAVGREAVGNRLQRIGASLEIFEVRVYTMHEPVEVEPPFPGQRQRLVEQIHQVGLPAT